MHGSAWTDDEIAEAFGCHVQTVSNVRQRFVEQALTAALERKKQVAPSRQSKLDGEQEARLITLTVRGVSASRSTAVGRTLGNSLHAQTWQLVEYREVRTERHDPAMSRSMDSRRRYPPAASSILACST
jgi:transposase